MSTEPRTATVKVLVTRPLEIDEPDWCTGHSDDHAEFKVDVTHYGPEHVLGAHGHEVLHAMLAQSPYSQISTPATVLYVEDGHITGSYTPAEVEELADALAETTERLRALGRQLAELLAGGTA